MAMLQRFFERLAGPSKDQIAFREAVSAGDRLRDANSPEKAVGHYEDALRLRPDEHGVRVQLANMAKDSGDFERAEKEYLSAADAFLSALGHAKDSAEKQVLLQQVADVYCQLGHLNKDHGQPHAALDYYRASLVHFERPDVQHELKHLESVANDIMQLPGAKARRPAVTPRSARPLSGSVRSIEATNDFLFDLKELMERPADELAIRKSSFQCVCWGSDFQLSRGGWVECRHCGTQYNSRLLYLNERGLRADVPLDSISAADLDKVLAAFGVPSKAQDIALINARLAGTSTTTAARIHSVAAHSDGIADRGIPRLSYDVIVVPTISYGISDLNRFLDDCHKLLKPSGILIAGFRPNPMSAASFQPADKAEESTFQDRPVADLFYQFNPRTLLLAMQIEARNSAYLGQHQVAGQPWLGARKANTMSMGVMSGIGDAAWSFMFAEAVMKKYGAGGTVLHIHHSGDFRAKRSNNMLARFSFIQEIAASRFDIHASPPMNDQTGHINYHPSGPVPLSHKDEFDYRLVFNTYFEHGWSVEQVCERFELPVKDVDYAFFEKYLERPEDLKPLKKLKGQLGDDYIVFHYGALNTNSEEGLNRGEIWKPSDWNRLGRMLHEKFGCKIALIGAIYDLEYCRRVQAQTDDEFYVNTMGQMDITETLALIKRARMIVSFPSGVGIVGPYMQVPTCIFWRPKDNPYHPMHPRSGFEPEFSHNWVPPARLKDGSYYPAWYGTDTPESLFNVIVENNWWEGNPIHRKAVQRLKKA